jgi:hypothetical protein
MWSTREVYVISKKDQDDLDEVLTYEDFFVEGEEDVFVNETMEKLWLYSQPETWNSKKFVELFKTLDQDNWHCAES